MAILRYDSTRSEAVETTIPSFAKVEHAGTGASNPSTSTTQMRHEEMALRSLR